MKKHQIRDWRLILAILLGVTACIRAPTPDPATTSVDGVPDETTTTSSGSTTTALARSVPLPRLTPDPQLSRKPIVRLKGARLDVVGRCATATTSTETLLLAGGLGIAVISGDGILILPPFPSVPKRFLPTGSRFDFRGVTASSLGSELAEPMTPDCQYDDILYLLGALEPSVAELPTFAVEVVLANPAIGFGPTRITIDGACSTIEHSLGDLLVVWPEGAAAVLTDTSILVSRWEAFGEMVAASGDEIDLRGAAAVGQLPGAPSGCEHDGVFEAYSINPPRS